jgi:rhamnose transport system ATP-binding protein
MTTPLLQACNIVKYAYGDDGRKLRGTTVKLLSDASIELLPGEIHALIGENGAGKTTMIKALAGAVPHDGGTLSIGTDEVSFASTKDARARGISVIWQEFMLAPRLSVAENMFLGREIYRGGRLDHAAMQKQAKEALAPLGLSVDPQLAVERLSTSQQQVVEIAKAVNEKARILILDEPTASLSRFETERLFGLLRELRASGIGIILVTHRFDEVFAMADRVTVMKDGVTAGTHSTAGATTESLIELMVGRRMESQYASSAAEVGDIVLEVEDLVVHGSDKPVSLELRAGEIVGLAGLVGAGRTELARAIVGADPVTSGSVRFKGIDISGWSMPRRLEAGMAFVPEDRKTQGVLLPLSVQRNLAIASWSTLGKGPHVSRRAERALALRQVKDLRVVIRSVGQPVMTLSGGNQQKVAIGKWLTRERSVYILDEPTRGVDVAARRALYELMVAIVERGGAILMISSDLPEVLNMSDRLYVLRNGAISARFSKGEATEQRVLASMFPDVESASPGLAAGTAE